MPLSGATVAGIANNLPRQPTSFVGRERAVQDCLRFHRSARLLTVTGVGGSGKTRLALRLAERLLPEYPDGVWFVDLAPLTDPDRLPRSVASAMELAEEPGRSIRETLARHLAHRRTLLVLDNCEHVLEATATLAVSLLEAAAGLRVVATSRERLNVQGEQTYSVPTLSLPGRDETENPVLARESEAVRLFAERAMLVDSQFAFTDEDALVIGEICRRLDGIPLAIELAAARTRMLSVREIRDKLHDRFRLLTGARTAALPRHQTLRAAMQWSYDHLAPDEQELLRSLSVFTGGWTLEAAVAVCANGRDEFQVLDALTGLVNKSLIVVDSSDEGDSRYRFLETVRQYARDLQVERGEAEAIRRSHRDWFVAWAERVAHHLTSSDQAVWLGRMDRESDNLRSALDGCLEHDEEIDLAVRMADALQWLWVIRGYIHEGRDRLQAIIARTGSLEPTPRLASVLQGAGNMCYRLDDLDGARAYYQRALDMRERIGDTRGMAGSLGALGNVDQYQGRYVEALERFQRSLVINRQSGNKVWEASNLTCLGNCSRFAGDRAASRAYLEQAVALNREIGHRNGECFSLDGLGCLFLETGDYGPARACFDQALAIEREIGNEHEEAVTLSSLARLAMKEGDAALARVHFASAIRLMHRLGAGYQIAGCLQGLARILMLESQPDQAVRLWAFAQSFRQSVGARVEHEFDPDRDGLSEARGALTPAAFDAAWGEGSRMSLDEAIEYGIGDH